MTNRTDPHRKGAIIPGDYEIVHHYALSRMIDGWPEPSIGVNCELDFRHGDAHGNTVNGKHAADGHCCIIGLLHIAKVKMAEYGTTGKCTACGAIFSYGEVWRHLPTGEHIHLGYDCAHKYGLLSDHSAFEIMKGRREAATAAQLTRRAGEERRRAFLELNAGLEADLAVDHHIIRDIADRFLRFDISEKQVALVRKIAHEIRRRAHRHPGARVRASPHPRQDGRVRQLLPVQARGARCRPRGRGGRRGWRRAAKRGRALGLRLVGEAMKDCWGQELIPCKVCGDLTSMTGTKFCDPCWNLGSAVRLFYHRHGLRRLIGAIVHFLLT